MNRTIRPIGAVPPGLKRHGYRQLAYIFVDGKQVENTMILSLKEGDRIKFEGHFIGPDGELHKTKPVFDIRRAANRIMSLRDLVVTELTPVAKPAAKPTTRRKPPASTDAARMCKKGCGFLHLDDTPCV